ncbi:hypothetical protein [Pseudomonas sp.]|uniref:hypothetical protein n=1 Tax=Pseudomonas sp. TaxID=306 RepID=UPI0025859758|nr:hypothetical protein [Pseudomonas sp.]
MVRTDSFHHYNDGRGRRRVFVNGNEVSHVKWCDTDKGIAIYCPLPLRVKRPASDEVYTRRLTGVVTVDKVE